MIATLLAAAARAVAGGTVRWARVPVDDRQRVFFANHTSHLDFILIWASLPARMRKRARPVAARDYWDSGPIRRYLARKVFRAVLIDRAAPAGERADRSPGMHGQEAVARMVQELDRKDSLIVFPEGTRGSGDEVGEFKSGLYYLWRERPDVELVPVHLENLNRVLPKGEFIPVPMISRVSFGPPLDWAEGETKEAFLERARRAVQQLGEQ
jgi:1-acyl-sn-glycerol-3-phosphate acyltransferase